jgi:hypothetical protein
VRVGRLASPIVAAALTACSFHSPVAHGTGDDASPSPDGSPDGSPGAQLGDVPHVPVGVEMEFAATAAVTIDTATLDTGGGGNPPAIDISLPQGASLIASPQDGGGPDLAILEVGSLTVTGTLRVRGTRALVIIARDAIALLGTIDGSAARDTPGPAGHAPMTGPGRGGDGANASTYNDSGGGGGGFGGAGGAGQSVGAAVGGTAGVAYGTPQLVRLEGGSGGGDMSTGCSGREPGAGGGAIQLYTLGVITIGGSIRVNGGGGGGGHHNCGSLATSGTGGGAGGAIYVQGASVAGTGLLLAQGGGGGGASNFNTNTPGGDGANGAVTISAATGGTGGGAATGEVNDGGTGGYRDAAPPSLPTLSGNSYGNAGGGGGAVGRIVVRAASPTAMSSPQAVILP